MRCRGDALTHFERFRALAFSAKLPRGPNLAPEAVPVEVVDPAGGNAFAAFLAAPPGEALADRAYVADPEGPAEFDAAIQRLRSSNWYLQNPAVRDGMVLLSEGRATLLQAFIFGRNLYQAAVGTAADAMRLVEDFSSRVAHYAPPLVAAVYAGALFEVYFDGEGALRYVPKDGQIGPLLRHQRTAALAPAIGFIRERLADAHLLVRPSPDAPMVRLTISFDGDTVTAVMLGAIPLTEPQDVADFGASPLPGSASWRRLRSFVADYFAAPKEQIDLDPTFEGTRVVADLQFRPEQDRHVVVSRRYRGVSPPSSSRRSRAPRRRCSGRRRPTPRSAVP